MRLCSLLLLAAQLAACAPLRAAEALPTDEPRVITGTAPKGVPRLNELIVSLLRRMPEAGEYAANSEASRRLSSSVELGPRGLLIEPRRASPSYCSGATYLVFLQACQRLHEEGAVGLDAETLKLLLVRGQADGAGVWGRWNANGPGTARLFYEAKLGSNFTDFSKAQPGDFMKIFWNDHVGRKERGHSVIFLGQVRIAGVEHVRFWSSNQPDGYGEKTVPRARIIQAIFSRLENPENLSRLRHLPAKDPYLASLLTVSSSIAEARAKSGL